MQKGLWAKSDSWVDHLLFPSAGHIIRGYCPKKQKQQYSYVVIFNPHP